VTVLLISAAWPTRHGWRTYKTKTLANLSYSRDLYTPQHTRDEAIGNVDRNKHFNDVQSRTLFIKQKKKKENK